MSLRGELRRLDKNVFRPIGRAVVQAGAFLDRTVPGWSVVASVLTPILPFIPAVTAALNAAARVSPLALGSAIQVSGNFAGVVPGLGQVDAIKAVRLPTQLQNELAEQVKAAAERWASEGARALNPIKITLAKAAHAYATERGSLAQHLERLAIEIAEGIALTVQLAAYVVPGAQPLALALTAAQTGRKVAEAYRLARHVKAEAKKARTSALAEIARIQAEERALVQEIERLRALRSSRQAREIAVRADHSNTSAVVALVVLGAVGAAL